MSSCQIMTVYKELIKYLDTYVVFTYVGWIQKFVLKRDRAIE